MEKQAVQAHGKASSGRFTRIRQELLDSPVWLCPERALLITEYFRSHDDPSEPMVIRKARALSHLLRNKQVKIFDDELIVGNMGTKRKSALIQPELAGCSCAKSSCGWIKKDHTAPHLMAGQDEDPAQGHSVLALQKHEFPGILRQQIPDAPICPGAARCECLSHQRSGRHRALPARLRKDAEPRRYGISRVYAGQEQRSRIRLPHRLQCPDGLCRTPCRRGRAACRS